jgi:rare lipoprotein A
VFETCGAAWTDVVRRDVPGERRNDVDRTRCVVASTAALVVLGIAVALAVQRSTPEPERPAGRVETGLASVYSDALDGKRTASGEVYRKSGFTAAHRTLPFGTRVRVTNPKNQKSVHVTVTDRGPREARLLVDLSRAAFTELGVGGNTVLQVRLEVAEPTAVR